MTEGASNDVRLYRPWHADKYPLNKREITAVNWTARQGLQLDVAETFAEPACLRISFRRVYAFQAKDEGYRLADIAVGDALVYSSDSSHYLTAFHAAAASTVDRLPLVHWLIVSSNQCVDVISENQPEMTHLR